MPVTAFETTDFECGRIKELESEHLRIQKKTFTKWMNSFMEKNELLVRNADAVYIRDHVLGSSKELGQRLPCNIELLLRKL